MTCNNNNNNNNNNIRYTNSLSLYYKTLGGPWKSLRENADEDSDESSAEESESETVAGNDRKYIPWRSPSLARRVVQNVKFSPNLGMFKTKPRYVKTKPRYVQNQT